MSIEDDKAIAAAVVERVMDRGDLAPIDDYYAAGYIEHDVLPPSIPPGREGMRQLMAVFRAAFPDLHYAVYDVVADGDKAVLRVTGSGAMHGPLFGLPSTGRSASRSEIHISRLDRGKVVERWSVTDQLGMLQQLGLSIDAR